MQEAPPGTTSGTQPPGLDPQQVLIPVQLAGRPSFMRIAISADPAIQSMPQQPVLHYYSAIAHKAAGAEKADT